MAMMDLGRVASVSVYLETDRQRLQAAEGYCLTSESIAMIAADWPDLTVAELTAAFLAMQATRRARRRVQTGRPLQ